MSGIFLKRAGAAAGVGVFILALFAQASQGEAGMILLIALLAGFGVGGAVFLAGSLVEMTASGPEPAQGERPELSAETPATLEETRTLEAGEVVPAVDLSQTVRLDKGVTDYVLPEMSHEDLFREREGIDEAFLKQGIEGTGAVSENIPEGGKEGGQKA